jgi:hypothetical protein
MDAEGGEKIEVLWELYQVLLGDAIERSILCEELYGLSASTLSTFRNLQGIEPEARFQGASLDQACQIWRQTPRQLMDALLGAIRISRPRGIVQSGPVMLFFEGETPNKDE